MNIKTRRQQFGNLASKPWAVIITGDAKGSDIAYFADAPGPAAQAIMALCEISFSGFSCEEIQAQKLTIKWPDGAELPLEQFVSISILGTILRQLRQTPGLEAEYEKVKAELNINPAEITDLAGDDPKLQAKVNDPKFQAALKELAPKKEPESK